MLALILTWLAGVALGVVIMRLLNAAPDPAPKADLDPAQPAIAPEIAPDVATSPSPLERLSSLSRKQIMLGGAGIMAAAALAVLALRPAGTTADVQALPMAVANPAAAGANTQLDDVDTMISRLEQRLQANPNDGEGYRMLGWSYQNTGKPAEAIKAYAQAVRLLPGRADVLAGYGEALVAVAADKVTPEAKAQFEAALRADAQQPRARFFLSLYKAQNGQEAAALEEWIALSNSATADQPWQGDVQKRINALAAKLGKDIKGRLKAPAIAASETPIISSLPGIPAPGAGPDAAALAAADTLSEAERQTMINGMVNGLAEKLKKNPQDPDGWAKLLRSRMVLKQTSEARADLANARKALAADPAKLQYVDAAAKELGL